MQQRTTAKISSLAAIAALALMLVCSASAGAAGQLQIGKATIHRNNGSATLEVTAAAGGKLTLTGGGVKKKTRTLSGPATVRLAVVPTARTLEKLQRDRKAKVTVKVFLESSPGRTSRAVTTVQLEFPA